MTGLHHEIRGRRGAHRVVLVHGFTQTSACWAPVDSALATRHEVVAVDAPGHGRSSEIDVDFTEAASLIGRTGGRGCYLGYSMGGRLALALAVLHPELVERLVLVGASPGLADATERRARRSADERLADHVEAVGVGAFLDEWLAQPLFSGLSASTAHRAERMSNTTAGLAASLRSCGVGAQPSYWDRLGSLPMPVLLVAGSADPKFAAIADQMATAIGPRASVAILPGAGHTAHLEDPDAFVDLVETFLAAAPAGSSDGLAPGS